MAETLDPRGGAVTLGDGPAHPRPEGPGDTPPRSGSRHARRRAAVARARSGPRAAGPPGPENGGDRQHPGCAGRRPHEHAHPAGDGIELTVPAPGEGWEQAVLEADEAGVLSWHFAKTKPDGAPLRGA